MKKKTQFCYKFCRSNDFGITTFHLEMLRSPDDLHLEGLLALDQVELLVVLPNQDPHHGVGAHCPYVVIFLWIVKCLELGSNLDRTK